MRVPLHVSERALETERGTERMRERQEGGRTKGRETAERQGGGGGEQTGGAARGGSGLQARADLMGSESVHFSLT